MFINCCFSLLLRLLHDVQHVVAVFGVHRLTLPNPQFVKAFRSTLPHIHWKHYSFSSLNPPKPELRTTPNYPPPLFSFEDSKAQPPEVKGFHQRKPHMTRGRSSWSCAQSLARLSFLRLPHAFRTEPPGHPPHPTANQSRTSKHQRTRWSRVALPKRNGSTPRAARSGPGGRRVWTCIPASG